MFGRQKEKVIDWLESPSRENEKIFHSKNIELSDILWNLADENLLSAIENALEDVLTKRHTGEYVSYPNLNDYEVINIYDLKKIELFSSIPDYMAEEILKKINNHLNKNRSYAHERGMKIPSGRNLRMSEYYENYLISKEIMKLLNIQTYKSK